MPAFFELRLMPPNAKVTGADAAGYDLECSFKPERHRRPVDRRVGPLLGRYSDAGNDQPPLTGSTDQDLSRPLAMIQSGNKRIDRHSATDYFAEATYRTTPK